MLFFDGLGLGGCGVVGLWRIGLYDGAVRTGFAGGERVVALDLSVMGAWIVCGNPNGLRLAGGVYINLSAARGRTVGKSPGRCMAFLDAFVGGNCVAGASPGWLVFAGPA